MTLSHIGWRAEPLVENERKATLGSTAGNSFSNVSTDALAISDS